MDAEDTLFQEQLESFLGEKLCSANLFTALGDGTILCKLSEKRQANRVFNRSPKDAAEKRENIQLFLNDCKSIRIDSLFKSTDLLLRRNLPLIITTVNRYIQSLTNNTSTALENKPRNVSRLELPKSNQEESAVFEIEIEGRSVVDKETELQQDQTPNSNKKQLLLQQMSLSTKSFKKSNLLADFFKEVSELPDSPRGVPSPKSTCACSSLSCLCSTTQGSSTAESPVELALLERKHKTRLNVINEIYETERAFVSDLEICVNKYLRPVTDSGILTDEEREWIFCNIADVWVVNRKLLKDLDTRRLRLQSTSSSSLLSISLPVPIHIADIFIQRGKDMIEPYTRYCCNHSVSLEGMEKCQRKKKDFAVFLSKVQQFDKEVRSLDLASFLVKPVQRICRYSLLLKELLRNTPEDEEEYQKLLMAIDVMNGVVDKINLNKRGVENRSKITEIEKTFRNLMSTEDFQLITANRVFIREGRVLKMNLEKSKAERCLFLFSDILVCTKEKKGGSYSITAILPLVRVQIKDLPDIEALQIVNAFEISLDTNQSRRYFLSTVEPEEKRSWINDIKRSISTHIKEFESSTKSPEFCFNEPQLWLLNFKNKLTGSEGVALFGFHRHLIKDGEVFLSFPQQIADLQPRQLFLFNDALLIVKFDVVAKLSEDGIKKNKKKFSFKDLIPLDQLIIVNLPSSEVQFLLIKREAKLKPVVITTDEKGKWIESFINGRVAQMYTTLESLLGDFEDLVLDKELFKNKKSSGSVKISSPHDLSRYPQQSNSSPTQSSYFFGGRGNSSDEKSKSVRMGSSVIRTSEFNTSQKDLKDRDRLSKRLSVPSIKMLLSSGASSLSTSSPAPNITLTCQNNHDNSDTRNTIVKVIAPENQNSDDKDRLDKKKSVVKEKRGKRGSILSKSPSSRDVRQHSHSKSK